MLDLNGEDPALPRHAAAPKFSRLPCKSEPMNTDVEIEDAAQAGFCRSALTITWDWPGGQLYQAEWTDMRYTC